jgi:hypothetical protein
VCALLTVVLAMMEMRFDHRTFVYSAKGCCVFETLKMRLVVLDCGE